MRGGGRGEIEGGLRSALHWSWVFELAASMSLAKKAGL